MIIITTIPASAQESLNINSVFSLYGRKKGCKMVEMHDCTIKGYKLSVYKSLEYTTHQKEIESLLNKDREDARKVQEVINGGVLLGGYYIMPQTKKSQPNRYILYRRGKGTSPSVIVYMEGNINPDELMKITRK